MYALAFALALFAQDPAPAADAPARLTEAPLPAGAPADDYQFVAWCYGALRGYVDLHDEVMPEVKRIESTFRPPGRKLEDDLKTYADQMAQGRKDLARFQAALTAAARASLQPSNTVGAQAVRRGRSVWNAGPTVTKARKAQEWMSWTLPARCTATADALEARAKLLGASFRVNAEPEQAPAAAEAPSAPTEAAPTEAAPRG